MDKAEARTILAAKLNEYRTWSYDQLRERVNEQDTVELAAPSGAIYQVEIQYIWDDKPNGDIRVMGSIDDGGWRSFFPLDDSFIRALDGRFVGEDDS